MEKLLIGDSVEGLGDRKTKTGTVLAPVRQGISGGSGAKQSQPFILIKTTKSDKYDRYLADVFIPQKDGSNLYLNNELLEKKLAVRVSE